MASIFEKWDSAIDTEGLKADIKEAAENGGTGNFKEVPHGQYEVSVEKMEIKSSSKGDPMVSIWFNILEGEFKNNKIFMNQVINQGFQIHIVNEFLKKLIEECTDAPEIEFDTYAKYSDLIMDVHEVIDGNYEYLLDYGQNSKNPNYNTYEIKEVFILD